MSEIKLLALDLDGTLFTKDKQVTAENRAALKSAEAEGVHVVITTGRPLPAITHILEDLGLLDDKHYSVTFNLVPKLIQTLSEELKLQPANSTSNSQNP